jgi:hypothetical protein
MYYSLSERELLWDINASFKEY